jgi:hypothetical protein
MKNITCTVTILAALCCAHGQTTDVPEWKALVKVVDEVGRPIPGADVTIGYYVPAPPGKSTATSSVKGTTDTNGLFSASGRTASTDLFFGAGKKAHYRSHSGHEFANLKNDDPAKWNPSVTLLLKKIAHPIPMYAKLIAHGPPALNEPVGFDLTAGDWVAPHGKGRIKDFIFTKRYSFKSTTDYEGKVTVTFSNQGDGIQVYQPSTIGNTSTLRSPHEAPESGYEPELTRETSAHPGQPSKFEYKPDRIYLFRVRTVLDEKGKVKSALYGKIYGDFMQFRYYLDPTPNDHNIEFDPKQNMLHGLKPTEQVSVP